MTVPLLILAFLSIVGGYLKEPLLRFLHLALPQTIEAHAGVLTELRSEAIAGVVFLIGALLCICVPPSEKRSLADALVANPVGRTLHQWWFADWGFDWIYDKAFVQPFIWATQINKSDFVDALYTGIARLAELSYRGLSSTETGRVRWYAAAMAAGSVLFIALVIVLMILIWLIVILLLGGYSRRDSGTLEPAAAAVDLADRDRGGRCPDREHLGRQVRKRHQAVARRSGL